MQWPGAYSKPFQTSKMKSFVKIVKSCFNYFRRTLDLRCLAEFWIRLWWRFLVKHKDFLWFFFINCYFLMHCFDGSCRGLLLKKQLFDYNSFHKSVSSVFGTRFRKSSRANRGWGRFMKIKLTSLNTGWIRDTWEHTKS